jgi:hypothetical protein
MLGQQYSSDWKNVIYLLISLKFLQSWLCLRQSLFLSSYTYKLFFDDLLFSGCRWSRSTMCSTLHEWKGKLLRCIILLMCYFHLLFHIFVWFYNFPFLFWEKDGGQASRFKISTRDPSPGFECATCHMECSQKISQDLLNCERKSILETSKRCLTYSPMWHER